VAFDLSEEELAKTEDEIGARFPESYRSAMKARNGGTIEALEEEWELFPIRDTSSPKRLSRTGNHVLHETQAAKKWTGYPERTYAIASNGAGDLLVIFQEGRAFRPQVFAWSHEDGALTLIASDLGELM
jgi:hypothetical protein